VTRPHEVDSFEDVWVSGLIAGTLGGALMAVWLTVASPPTIARAIPGLYGLSGPIAGWAFHLTHGAVFGTMFAALALGTGSRPTVVGLGLGFALVLWFVGAGTIMPIWLQSVGFPGASELTVPNLRVPILVAHLVYGAVVGLTLPVLTDRRES
jgi:hypothetical protein